MQHNTLTPSTRAGQNEASSSLTFFFHDFAHFTNRNRQILPNVFFAPLSPKYPILSGNKQKFRENDKDLKDTFKSSNCCYPLFMKHL